MKREKTQYKGVYFRQQKKLGSDSLEKVYYIFYRTGGRGSKQVEEPVGRESEGMTAAKASHIRADRARQKELNNREQREAIEQAKQAEEAKPTIERLWLLYDESNPDRKSRKTDTGFYRNHLAPSFANKLPDEIVTLDIDRLRIKKLKTLSPQTVKHILSLLRRVIRFGVKQGRCEMPLPSRLHFTFPKVENQKTENLTKEQMVAFLKALDEEPDQNAAAFIRLALTTGMRRGAIMALQWSDIDFERGFITLRGESAKNEKTERIPMSGSTGAVLEKIDRTDSPYVFPGRNGGQRKDFKRISKRVRDKAGLPADFRPLHGLRHTFASWMASSGDVDLYTLQKMLTHSSPVMTQRYAHLADEAMQRAAAVAGKLFDMDTDKDEAKVIPFEGKK